MYITQASHSSSLLKSKNMYFPGQYDIGEEIVNVRTLDDWVQQERVESVDILKLDTQGYELKILKEGRKILKKVSLVYSEVNFHPQYKGSTNFFELTNYLHQNGFQFFNIYNIYRINNIAIFSDALFVNESIIRESGTADYYKDKNTQDKEMVK